MPKIGKDGKVHRLKKSTWDITIPYDTNPDAAIEKMQARIANLERQLSARPAPTAAPHGCNFDEKKLGTLIRDTMEEVLKPFMGG